jgi:hypothetical protein
MEKWLKTSCVFFNLVMKKPYIMKEKRKRVLRFLYGFEPVFTLSPYRTSPVKHQYRLF